MLLAALLVGRCGVGTMTSREVNWIFRGGNYVQRARRDRPVLLPTVSAT